MAAEKENENETGSEQQQQEEAPPPPPAEEESPEPGRTYFVSVSLRPLSADIPDEDLVQMTRHYAIKGFLFAVVGIVAILFPLLFGLAVEQLLAWLLVLGGAVTLVQFVMVCGSPGTTSFLLLGALHFAVGLWLLLKPAEGLTALTYVLAGWFVGHGLLKFLLAFQVRRLTTWVGVLVSGFISITLGIAIVVLVPKYGLQLLGIVVGADLLSTGISLLLVSLMSYLGRGHRTISDAEALDEPLIGGGDGNAAAASA